MNEETMINIALLLMGILIILLLIIIFTLIPIDFSFYKKKKNIPSVSSVKKENLDRKMELLLSYDNPVERVNNMIDTLIHNAASIYMIYNVNFDKDKYINKSESEQLKLYIYGMVKKSMTPVIKELIGLVYNIKGENALQELLLLRINLYVLNTLVNNRKPIS